MALLSIRFRSLAGNGECAKCQLKDTGASSELNIVHYQPDGVELPAHKCYVPNGDKSKECVCECTTSMFDVECPLYKFFKQGDQCVPKKYEVEPIGTSIWQHVEGVSDKKKIGTKWVW